MCHIVVLEQSCICRFSHKLIQNTIVCSVTQFAISQKNVAVQALYTIPGEAGGRLLRGGSNSLTAVVQRSEVVLKASHGAGGVTLPGPPRKGQWHHRGAARVWPPRLGEVEGG